MKIVTASEAEFLLENSESKTIQIKPLSNFRTAYIDYIGAGEYLISIDETPIGIVNTKKDALLEFAKLH